MPIPSKYFVKLKVNVLAYCVIILKRSNAHEVTLRAVLGMLFMYLCPHLVRRQMLKTPRASDAFQYVCVQ